MEVKISQTVLRLLQGDITLQKADAIVNAANSSLMGGGGVDGAIHLSGGPQILLECKEIVRRRGRCAPGQAVITSGGNLQADFVIHTVGPVWHGGTAGEPQVLKDAYYNSLRLAKENGLKTIAFPSISTGAYGYPVKEAAQIAIATIVDYIKEPFFQEVRIVLFNEKILKIYEDVLKGREYK